MSDGPNIWNIGDDIVIEIFLVNVTDGLALTGQDVYTEITIRRDTDSKWWTGTAWSTTRTVLYPLETDSTNEPGRYTYTLPGTAGNIKADRYVFHVKADNPPTIEASSVESHVSRQQNIRIYEAEPA